METLTCTYAGTIYRNTSNGYTTFSVNARDHDEYRNEHGQIICKGKVPIYSIGIPLELTGELDEKKFSPVFKVVDSQIINATKETTIEYILNCKIKGIGEKKAAQLIDLAGEDFFAFFDNEDAEQQIMDTIHIPKEKIHQLVTIVRSTTRQRTVYEYIYPFGGTFGQTLRLCEKFGENALQKIKEDCYTTCSAAGISFYTSDAIAKKQGILAYEPERMIAIFRCALKVLNNCGNTRATINDISRIVNSIEKNSAFTETIPKTLLAIAAASSRSIIAEENVTQGKTYFYLYENWKAEKNTFTELNRIQRNSIQLKYSKFLPYAMEESIGIKYSSQQMRAFEMLKSTGIKILTGGPGTGKTTTINGLIQAYKIMCPEKRIMCCAPTGRAAQQITASTGIPASTIHKLLDIHVYGDTIMSRDLSNPLPVDFLIVDEMSMTDVNIFSMLVKAIDNGTLVLLCGDTDQLPSVGAGKVLYDIIDSGKFETYKLSAIYRQDQHSKIVENAGKINNQDTELTEGKDFEIIVEEDENKIIDKIKELTNIYYSNDNPCDFQVLTTIKKDKLGTKNLNKIIQNTCNPPMSEEDEIANFRTNDKIMTTANNYKSGYVNGDIGIVLDTNAHVTTVKINNEEIPIGPQESDDLSLAYAITIHKSQGAEYQTVAVVLPKDPEIMLQKNLLYTAITRAKKKVIIISQGDAYKIAIKQERKIERNTSLLERLNHDNFSVVITE